MRAVKALIITIVTALMTCAMSFCAYADVERIDPSQFDGNIIAMESGNMYVPIIPNIIKDPQFMYFSNQSDCVTAVVEGKADAAISDLPIYEYLHSIIPGSKIGIIGDTVDYLAFASGKNEKGQKIIDDFNRFLSAYKEDGRLERLRAKWLNGPEEQKVMESYKDLPATNGVLRVATCAAIPPLEYFRNGEIVGYEIELIYQYCKEAGLGLEIDSMDFASVIPGIATGKYDIGVSDLTITEERKKSVIFSDPVIESMAAVFYMDHGDNDIISDSYNNIKDSFYKTFIQEDRWKMFLDGIGVTLFITVSSILGGCILGFAIHLVCRTGNKVTNAISKFCRWLIQGMPEIVFLMVLFYIVFGKSSIDGMWVASIGFTILFTCFIHGMLCAGEAAIDKGQYYATAAMGYSDLQAFFLIILPQTLKFCVPSFMIQITTHLKATAVVGYIAVIDVTKVGDLIRGRTYDAFFPLIAVAIIYFILAAILKFVLRTIVNKLDTKTRTEEEIKKGLVIE